jgi:hypothetical protein
MLHTITISGSEDFPAERVLARPGFRLREHLVYFSNVYQSTRKPIALASRLVFLVFPSDALLGDNRVFVVEAAS